MLVNVEKMINFEFCDMDSVPGRPVFATVAGSW